MENDEGRSPPGTAEGQGHVRTSAGGNGNARILVAGKGSVNANVKCATESANVKENARGSVKEKRSVNGSDGIETGEMNGTETTDPETEGMTGAVGTEIVETRTDAVVNVTPSHVRRRR